MVFSISFICAECRPVVFYMVNYGSGHLGDFHTCKGPLSHSIWSLSHLRDHYLILNHWPYSKDHITSRLHIIVVGGVIWLVGFFIISTIRSFEVREYWCFHAGGYVCTGTWITTHWMAAFQRSSAHSSMWCTCTWCIQFHISLYCAMLVDWFDLEIKL